jgi:adenine C2-methylase RlmN of 23S rRNA A2503 and tRNA A37
MGMAEPLANLENGLLAIRIINAEWGLIGARHITISTSGLAPQIRKGMTSMQHADSCDCKRLCALRQARV